jgi:hypothetical protein
MLRLRLPSLAIDVVWNVAEIDRSNRPKADIHHTKWQAAKPPFVWALGYPWQIQ